MLQMPRAERTCDCEEEGIEVMDVASSTMAWTRVHLGSLGWDAIVSCRFAIMDGEMSFPRSGAFGLSVIEESRRVL